MDGPYAGKFEKFIKTGSEIKLEDDSSFNFFQFYGSLRSHLSQHNFSRHLLPDLHEVHPHVDLSRPPMIAEYCALVGVHSIRLTKESVVQLHNRLAEALYTILKASIKDTCDVGRYAINKYYTKNNGFKVLTDLMERHHPRMANSRARDYEDVKAEGPNLLQSQESVDSYYASFLMWMETLQLYPDFIHFKPSHISIAFIEGLHKPYDTLLLQEKDLSLNTRSSGEEEQMNILWPGLSLWRIFTTRCPDIIRF